MALAGTLPAVIPRGHLRGALFLLTAITGVGFALAGDSVTVEAQEYSAYDDPERPALSLVLSEKQNLEEFQTKFGLTAPCIRLEPYARRAISPQQSAQNDNS